MISFCSYPTYTKGEKEAALNGYQIYHCFLSGFISIRKQRAYLNRINVFPVADGDTGNNLVRTIKQIVSRLESNRSASKVLNSIARISLESARGNSGLIFSQYLNGLAINTDGKDTLSIHDFAEAAVKSVKMAYDSIENPVEGTILTVLNAWSYSLYEGSKKKKPLGQVFEKALITARLVMGNTKNQLPVLIENDVIDAGAMGVVSFLEGVELLRYTGPVPSVLRKSLSRNGYLTGQLRTETKHSLRNEIKNRYCTELLLEKPRVSPDKLKRKLTDKGDSLIVSAGTDRYRIHIHSNKPHEVVSLLRQYGDIINQKADDMIRQEQVVNNRIAGTAVLTDSIADISQEILDRYQIHVINLTLLWDEEEYIDRITISPQQFYKMQQIRSSFPGSSIPSESMVISMYQYLTENYESVIVLAVGKNLSGTWNQMSKIAERFNREGKKIAVIDTCLNSVAQGLLVCEIAKEAAAGKDLGELIQRAEDLKRRIKIYVRLRTFKFMVKGGRVPPLKGAIASTFHINPIVTLDENGRGIVLDKAFSRRGLVKKLSGIIKTADETKGIESYAIVHAAAEKEAEGFSDLVEKLIGKRPSYISNISPIVGMHSGKGALAIALIEEE